MAQTYMGTAVRMGSGTLTDTVDGGFVDLLQTAVLVAPSTATSSSVTITVPAGSQLYALDVDRIVAQSGGTGTTLLVTVGTVAGGTQYAPSTDTFTTGRTAFTFTPAQLAAMGDVGTNRSVVLTVTANGTATVPAQYRFNVRYVQKI